MASFANRISTIYHRTPVSSGARMPLASTLVRLASAIRLWHGRIRERQTLAGLSDRELRDIGLSQWDVHTELAKPFWRG